MATLDELVVRIKADASQLERELKKAGSVAATSGKQIERGFGGALKSLRGEAGALNGMLANLAGTMSAGKLIAYADSWKVIEGRLRIATNSVGEMTAVQNALFDISQRTGTELSANAQLYGRLSIAAKELGKSSGELLELTELVGKAITISGGSASSSSGALLQFSQAIGGGIVRAEEFNSLLEGAPRLAQAAADGLDRAGGSVARLRTLVNDGSVSSREFFDAIVSQSAKLAAEFDKTDVTVSRALMNLNNEMLRFVGETDKVNGASAALSGGILVLADNIDILARAGIALAAVFTTRFALSIAASLTVMNPFLAAIYAVVGGLALLATRTGETEEAQKRNREEMARALDIKGKLTTATGNAAEELRKERDALLNSAKARLESAKAMLAEAKARQAAEKPLSGYALAKVGLSPGQLEAGDAVTAAEAAVAKAQGELSGFQDIFSKPSGGGGGGTPPGIVDPKGKTKKQEEAEDYDAAGDALSEYIDRLEQERELASLSGKALEERRAILEANSIAIRQNSLLSAEMQDKIRGEVSATYDAKEALEKLNKAQQESIRFNQEMKDKLSDSLTSIALSFDSAADSAKGFAMAIADTLLQKKVTGPLADSLIDSIDTGSIGSGLGKLFGGFYADGGRPPLGKVSVVGERGPELFVPDTAGTVIPNGALGGNQIIVQNHFNISPGIQGTVRSELMNAIPMIVNASKNAVFDAAARGGRESRLLGKRG